MGRLTTTQLIQSLQKRSAGYEKLHHFAMTTTEVEFFQLLVHQGKAERMAQLLETANKLLASSRKQEVNDWKNAFKKMQEDCV